MRGKRRETLGIGRACGTRVAALTNTLASSIGHAAADCSSLAARKMVSGRHLPRLAWTSMAILLLGGGLSAILGGITANPAAAANPACSTIGPLTTCEYTYTGTQQTFQIPPGVHQVTVTAIGASGGDGIGGGATPGGLGGVGGVAKGTLTVSPGSMLYVEVGGAGGKASDNSHGTGGFNGGGTGGTGGAGGGGGGGASDVRTVSDTTSATLASRLIVAGGGGGGGESPTPEGGSGGAAGAPGGKGGSVSTRGWTQQGGDGGGAGTQTQGGAGGAVGSYSGSLAENPGKPGLSGGLGTGGDGGTIYADGGGGGGGYYGGGGGGSGGYVVTRATGVILGTYISAAGGGGGGSSLVPANGTISTNSTNAPASVTISYTTVAALSITTTSLPDGTVGTDYPSTTLAASGGTTPYVWSAAGLPNGLTIDPTTGVISGMPMTAGTPTATIKVTANTGSSISKTMDFSIAKAKTILAASSAPYKPSVGSPSNFSVSIVTTPASTPRVTVTGTVTFTITGAVACKTVPLVKNEASCTTNAPAVAGPYTMLFHYQGNANFLPSTRTEGFTVITLKISTTVLPPGFVGITYSATLAATGGTRPYKWSTTRFEAPLPPGLSLDPTTGVISGIPSSVGKTGIVVTVLGATGNSASSVLEITVRPAPSITGFTPATGSTLGSTTVTINGTDLTSATDIKFGSLTAASYVDVSSTEIKAKTPASSAGPVKISVTVAGTQVSSSSTFIFVNPISISTTSLPGGTAGSAYPSTILSASGGVAPYAWKATGLPAGLNLKTGVIAGTPIKAGTSKVKITVTDSETPTAESVSKTFTVTVAAAASAPVTGYWTVAADGGVFSFGHAPFYGSMGGKPLNEPVVGMASTPGGGGYWLVASDGGIFSFGDAKFYGSMGGKLLNEPVVGMAATPTGKGYWEVASDGGIFSFGNARFYGSKGGSPLTAPIVGMAATPTGMGYWEVASDGAIFTFGAADSYGSMLDHHLNKPVVGMAATSTGKGYWLVASDGGIFSFGSARFYGSMGGKSLDAPMVGMSATSTGKGYWSDASDGGIFSYGTAGSYGSMGGKPLNKPMVGMATYVP